MGQLRDINGVVIGMQAYPHTKGSTLTVNVNQRMRADTDEIIELLRELDLQVSLIYASGTRRFFENETVDALHMQKQVVELSARIDDELGLRQFLLLNQEETLQFSDSSVGFGADISNAFPSSDFDITEAKKCIALGRFTASVMHLMRALEAPLKALASDLGVQGERQNWGDLINNIEPKINAMPNNSPHKATYSESAIQFRFIKNAWRNHAMHSREKYTAEEANIILIATKALMKSLSGTLHE
jgi:hypothetical protein